MTTLELLAQLRRLDIRLWTEGGRLRVSAPIQTLSPELECEIAKCRSEIIRILEGTSGLIGASESIRPVSREHNLPLTLAQRRLWFLNRLEPDSAAYTLGAWRTLMGPLDVPALERSINEMIRRHEILRTTFPDVDGTPIQVVAEPTWLSLAVIDLSQLSRKDMDMESQRLRRQEAKQSFDLQKGPLFRTLLLRLGVEEHMLLFSVHHIVCDGWSFGIIARELGELYIAFSSGRESPLPELSIQYADYAVWQRQWNESPEFDRQLKDSVRRLEGCDGFLPLPTDRPRPTIQTHNGNTYSVVISSDLADRVRALGREEGVTLYMTLMGAFAILLSRHTGSENVLIGSPIAGRDRVELEPLIGMFVNTVVVRADLSGNSTVRKLLLRIREAVLEAFANQDLPFEKLVEVLHPERNLSYSPLFQVALVLNNFPSRDGFEFTSVSSVFDLTLYICEEGREINAVFEYNSDLFDEATISRMGGHLQVLLEGIVNDSNRPIHEIPILSKAESAKLLVEWNGEKTSFPRHKCIHQLFEDNVASSPDSTALTILPERGLQNSIARKYSYLDLNRLANQLAFRLRALGVNRGSRVVLCLERSLEMIVSVLAILKAGGAYVPLDTTYPRERLQRMLDDVQADIILTNSEYIDTLCNFCGRIVPLDKIRNELENESDVNLPNAVAAESLAYIMYTSGSTGQPKGVCVTHKNVVRLVKNTNYADFSDKETFFLLAPISFDASTFEMWGSLLNGARLVVPPPGQLSLSELGDIIEENRITSLWLTAGLFHLMVEKQLSSLRGVRQLLAGGDVLGISQVRRVIEGLGDRLSYQRIWAHRKHYVYLLPPHECFFQDWLVCSYREARFQHTGLCSGQIPVPSACRRNWRTVRGRRRRRKRLLE